MLRPLLNSRIDGSGYVSTSLYKNALSQRLTTTSLPGACKNKKVLYFEQSIDYGQIRLNLFHAGEGEGANGERGREGGREKEREGGREKVTGIKTKLHT